MFSKGFFLCPTCGLPLRPRREDPPLPPLPPAAPLCFPIAAKFRVTLVGGKSGGKRHQTALHGITKCLSFQALKSDNAAVAITGDRERAHHLTCRCKTVQISVCMRRGRLPDGPGCGSPRTGRASSSIILVGRRRTRNVIISRIVALEWDLRRYDAKLDAGGDLSCHALRARLPQRTVFALISRRSG